MFSYYIPFHIPDFVICILYHFRITCDVTDSSGSTDDKFLIIT